MSPDAPADFELEEVSKKPGERRNLPIAKGGSSVPYGRGTTLAKQCRFDRPDLTCMQGLAVKRSNGAL